MPRPPAVAEAPMYDVQHGPEKAAKPALVSLSPGCPSWSPDEIKEV